MVCRMYSLLGVLLVIVLPQSLAAQSIDGGLKVFITNAEEDALFGLTVQVMDGKRQITGGVTDFAGFLFLPNIDEGSYKVFVRHISTGKDSFKVTIERNRIFELRTELEIEFPLEQKQEDSISSKVSDGLFRMPQRRSYPEEKNREILEMPINHQGPFNYPKTGPSMIGSTSVKWPKKDSSGYDIVLAHTPGVLRIRARDIAGEVLFGTRVAIEPLEEHTDSMTTWAVVGVDGELQIELLPGKYRVSVSHASVGGIRVFPITITANNLRNIRLEYLPAYSSQTSVFDTRNKGLAFVRPFQSTPIKQSAAFPEIDVFFK